MAATTTPSLVFPFAPGTVAPETQPFGPTSFTAEPPYAGYPHFHTGLDFGAAFGTTIYAANGGTVTTGWDPAGYGNYIIITAANGWKTLYGHLSRLLVTAGQQVGQGAQIGLEGSTGNSTGPHLHFGLQNPSGVWVDPTPYLTGNATLPAASSSNSGNQPGFGGVTDNTPVLGGVKAFWTWTGLAEPSSADSPQGAAQRAASVTGSAVGNLFGFQVAGKQIRTWLTLAVIVVLGVVVFAELIKPGAAGTVVKGAA